jgi:hypothetical protein
MAKFMLILHHAPNVYHDRSPEDRQRITQKYQSWADKIRASGRYVSSDKLTEEGGKVVTARDGRVAVVDGPFSEAKEVVGGFFLFRAETYEEALDMIRDCPHLGFGRIELRQTDSMGCGKE